MKRGSVVIVSVPGDYGKPRPAVVVQHTRLLAVLDSVVVALLTTSPEGGARVRIRVEPDAANGLKATSRIMVDKLFTLQRHRVSEAIGDIDAVSMAKVDNALRALLDLEPVTIEHPLGGERNR